MASVTTIKVRGAVPFAGPFKLIGSGSIKVRRAVNTDGEAVASLDILTKDGTVALGLTLTEHQSAELAEAITLAAAPGSYCAQCGSEVPAAQTGRPRLYCTDACRQQAHRDRHAISVGDRHAISVGVMPETTTREVDSVPCDGCREIGPLLTAPGTSGRSWRCECGYLWAHSAEVAP